MYNLYRLSFVVYTLLTVLLFFCNVLQIIRLNVNFINVSTWTGEFPDYVQIYDGANTDAPQLFNLYAPIPGQLPSFLSSQRYMFIRFISDDSVTYGGFNLTYSSIPQGTVKNLLLRIEGLLVTCIHQALVLFAYAMLECVIAVEFQQRASDIHNYRDNPYSYRHP